MTLQGTEFKKAALLGLVLAAVPLIYFPSTFGWPGAALGGPQLFLWEFSFYTITFYMFWKRERFSQILAGAGVAMGFRLCTSLITALLFGAIHALPAGHSFAQGLYGYLPSAILQVLLAPFLMRPVFSFARARRVPPHIHSEAPRPEPVPTERKSSPSLESGSWQGSPENMPNFDAAVAHIASYSTVELAALVDDEGLIVARAGRPGADHELWAPVVNRLHLAIGAELRRAHQEVKRFDLALSKHRLAVIWLNPFYLCVLYDHSTDDLVNVRVAQAVEMVKRYREHKYPKAAAPVAAEVSYV
jgi:hypothetical protein